LAPFRQNCCFAVVHCNSTKSPNYSKMRANQGHRSNGTPSRLGSSLASYGLCGKDDYRIVLDHNTCNVQES
jgi:hypothetical protein